MAIEIPQPGRRGSRLIAVWEPRPWWAPQLQHRFVHGDVGVRGCHRVQDIVELVPSIVIVDLSSEETVAIRHLAEVCEAAPDAFVMVIVPDELRSAEWRLRELGAQVVVGEKIGGDALAHLCCCALRTSSSAIANR